MRTLLAWLLFGAGAFAAARAIYLLQTSGAGPGVIAGTQAWFAALGLAFVAWLAAPPAPGHSRLRLATRCLLLAVAGITAFVAGWIVIARPPFG
jgi:hypothetical protein